jgi:predicted DCC family thiol-disulfide oxidoreductase YuxK
VTSVHQLVFDSQCDLCTELAQRLVEQSEGNVEPLSIRDPRAVRLLDLARPSGWTAQPYLVTLREGRPYAVAGWRLAVRTIRLIGLRGSWSLLRSMRVSARRHRR